MKHKESWYKAKMIEYNNYAKRHGKEELFNNTAEFEAWWNRLDQMDIKQKDRYTKYAIKYKTNYKTALAEKQVMKLQGKDITLEELKKMETSDFAALHSEDILRVYHDMRDSGATAKEARDFVSEYWFGSD